MFKKLIFVSCITATLTGCIPAVFVAGGAAGAVFATDNRNVQTISDDTDTAYQANNIIQADNALATKTHIVLTMFNGIALITGQAPTAELQQRPEKLLKPLKKIRKIYNQVIIADPIGAFTISNDAVVTTNVKTRMLTTTDLKSNQFKLVTENGSVYIMGLTSRKQAEMAVDVARHCTGVKQVMKLIEYVD